MYRKKILLPLFLIVAFVQLYIPAKMIFWQEDILKSGTEFKFITAPVDPNDPFRGKYIHLQFAENRVKVEDIYDYSSGEEVYAIIFTDESGFAKVKSVSKLPPDDSLQFLKVYVGNVWIDSTTIALEFPFDRYYMEESKAFQAEVIYNLSQTDSTKITYALVNVKNGEAVVKEVLIDGKPIKEIVQDQINKEKEE
jgi:uncharacterized membrane-anchored protein